MNEREKKIEGQSERGKTDRERKNDKRKRVREGGKGGRNETRRVEKACRSAGSEIDGERAR